MEPNSGPGRTYKNVKSAHDVSTSSAKNGKSANNVSKGQVKNHKGANNASAGSSRTNHVPSSATQSDSASYLKRLPLWVKIAVPCAVAIVIVIILLVLDAKGPAEVIREDDVNVSDTVQTPDVVGEYYEDAITIVEDAGMLLIVTGKENNEAFKLNHILSQNPRAKATAPTGSALLSKVSSGVKTPVAPGEAPDITFIPEGDAIALLESAKIEYSLTYVESDTVLRGIVVEQSIKPGASDRRQLEVSISTGSEAQDAALEAGGFEYLIENDSRPNIDQPAQQQSRTISADILEYGQCEFGAWRGEPIKWRALEVEGDRALLLSEDILLVRQYYNSSVDITWADSDIRSWLNDDFLNEAFSADEQKSILLTENHTPDNEYSGVPGGRDTEDSVFLLSIDEARKYFYKEDGDRIAEINMSEDDINYIINRYRDLGHAQKELDETEAYWRDNYLNQKQAHWWWLRSPGSAGFSPAYLGGEVNAAVVFCADDCGGVRPAIYINLEY